jgi:hypothetical protein
MTKQKKTKEVEQEQKKSFPKILPELYNTIEDQCMPILFLSFIVSVFSFLFIWTNMSDEYFTYEIQLNLHGFTWIQIIITLIIIMELIFLWINNNDWHITTELTDIILSKIIALIFAAPATTILLSGVVMVKELSWIKALGIMKSLGIVVLILIGLYIYFKVNQWLARKVQSS